MDVIGIIAEYNPFHKGHKYHIDRIKEMFPDSVIIACVSSCFTQRGEVSVLNKWDKSFIALRNGVNLVVELPFCYSVQSADIFAKGAIGILNLLGVNKIVFGSECNDIERLYEIASVQVNNSDFDSSVKRYLDMGNNYPTSISKALEDFNIKKIDSPNDLLGVSYIKEIIRNNYGIEAVTIKRTSNYHGNNSGDILSASEIRRLFYDGECVDKYIGYDSSLLYKSCDYFPFLRYQIINNYYCLDRFLTVDEGIENRIKKCINDVYSLNEMINFIKTKRYTYNKINRMFVHILTGFSKDDALYDVDYVRVLGFDDIGRRYLKKIKKDSLVPIITRYKDVNSPLLDTEKKVTYIYSLIVGDNSLIKKELSKPIWFRD